MAAEVIKARYVEAPVSPLVYWIKKEDSPWSRIEVESTEHLWELVTDAELWVSPCPLPMHVFAGRNISKHPGDVGPDGSNDVLRLSRSPTGVVPTDTIVVDNV